MVSRLLTGQRDRNAGSLRFLTSPFKLSRDQIGKRALRPLAVVLVGIDQQRSDRGVVAVGLDLIQPDPSLAGSVERRGDAAVAQPMTPDVQPDALPEFADDAKH